MKVIIITGTSFGLGLSIAKKCLEAGCSVFGIGRSPATLKETQNLKTSYPSTFYYQSINLTDSMAPSIILEKCIETFGRVDSIVHNAGIIEPVGKLSDIDLKEFEELMKINLFSGLDLVQKSLPQLRQNRGSIIFVSSGASVKPLHAWGAYCISKAAINMLVAVLGEEEPLVTSIAIRPGVVDTNMQEKIRNDFKNVMLPKDHQKFVSIKDDATILHPDKPASAIARFCIDPIADKSGQFISWDQI